MSSCILPRSALDELPPQGVHQPVGRGMQQQPKLVGHEPMATEAIRLYVKLEVLDPVLALPTSARRTRRAPSDRRPGGDDEAGVGPLLHRLGLVDDPALVLPACRPRRDLRRRASPSRLLARGSLVPPRADPGHLFEARVGDEGDGVGDALLFAVVVEGRNGEARVRPYLYLPPRAIFPSNAPTMRFKKATEELEAWVLPALKSAVIRCPLSPSKTSSGWYMCWR